MSDLRTSDHGRDRGGTAGATLRRISWGAIIAGAVLALMIQFMLGLLGLGIGLTGVEAVTASSSGGASLLSVAGIWALLVVLIGVFAGAYAAARFAGIPDKIDGMLHGVVTWAVAGLFAVYLLASGASSLVGGAFGVLGQSIDDLARAAEVLAPRSEEGLPQGLQRDVEMVFAAAPAPAAAPAAAESGGAEGEEAADDAVTTAAAPVATGNRAAALADVEAALGSDADDAAREAAVASIAAAAGVPRNEAERRFSRFQERYQATMTERRETAETAAGTLSGAAFGAFVAMLLGFAVAAAGGLFGRPTTVPPSGSSSRRSV